MYTSRTYNSNQREEEMVEYEDESDKNLYDSTVFVIAIINMIIFGLGVVMLVVGIIYLTANRYPYSFTTFSIDLMAGLFVASGTILIVYSVVGVFTLRPYGRPSLMLIYAIFTFVLFLFIFILGVIGLSMSSNGQFIEQNRHSMFYTAKNYDEGNPSRHSTNKIDWLHKNFLCCGIESYNDWKKVITEFRRNNQMKSADKYSFDNNYPYIDDVPDSCCVNPYEKCGKNINVFGRDRSTVIYTKGCLEVYNRQFNKDVVILCGLATAIGGIMLFTSVMMLFAFSLIRKNHAYLIRYAGNATKRALLN